MHQRSSHVNLDLLPGRITSVIAPQGAGKTTLLRAAAGLLGEIYNGEVTGSLEFSSAEPTPLPSLRSGRRDVAAFFDGYVQVTLAVETVREEIGLPLFAFGLGRAERDARVVAVAHELGIEYLLDRQVTELSGGEEKLVGIAAALVPDVAIHVLDEPFEQLDVAHLAAVIRAAKLRARAGRLVLVATGALDIALNIADSADSLRRRSVDGRRVAELRRRGAHCVAGRIAGDALFVRASGRAGRSPALSRCGAPRLMTDLLDMRDVSFGYGNGPPVLANATLSVPSYMVCGIVGPNGAGKSTLARLAAGVFQPRSGTVHVAGKDLRTTAGPTRARVVRVSFQDARARALSSNPRRGAGLGGVVARGFATGDARPHDGGTRGLRRGTVRSTPIRTTSTRGSESCSPACRRSRCPDGSSSSTSPPFGWASACAPALGVALRKYAAEGGAVMLVTHDHEFAAATCDTIAVVKRGKIDRNGPAATTLEGAAEHAGTNIYSFPSFYLDRAVRRRSKLPGESGRDLQV